MGFEGMQTRSVTSRRERNWNTLRARNVAERTLPVPVLSKKSEIHRTGLSGSPKFKFLTSRKDSSNKNHEEKILSRGSHSTAAVSQEALPEPSHIMLEWTIERNVP